MEAVHISRTNMLLMRNVPAHLLEVVDPAEVVDESGGVERVEAGEPSEAGGVVVVAVDAEDRHGDVHVGVPVVDLLPAVAAAAVLAVARVRKVDLGVGHEVDGNRRVAEDL